MAGVVVLGGGSTGEFCGALRRLGSGNYYALEVIKRLGLEDGGGAFRVDFVHYNTAEEIGRLGELSRLE